VEPWGANGSLEEFEASVLVGSIWERHCIWVLFAIVIIVAVQVSEAQMGKFSRFIC
jgi:hypothetical protein